MTSSSLFMPHLSKRAHDKAVRKAGEEDGAVRVMRKHEQRYQRQLQPQQATRRAPQFTIASAGTELHTPGGVPAWRVMVGNLAAGATAGCAVEAGEVDVHYMRSVTALEDEHEASLLCRHDSRVLTTLTLTQKWNRASC